MFSEFMCPYCSRGCHDIDSVTIHETQHHQEKTLKIRYKQIDSSSGQFIFPSVDFGIPLTEIKKKIEEGCIFQVDLEQKKLRFKRPPAVEETSPAKRQAIEKSVAVPVDDAQTEKNDMPSPGPSGIHPAELRFQAIEKIQNSLPEVMALFSGTEGRVEDFASVFQSLADGSLDADNTSLSLLLDVGRYLRQGCASNMRYPKESIDFWTVVYKIFKAKAIRFFSSQTKPTPVLKGGPRIGAMDGFAVPSISTLLS